MSYSPEEKFKIIKYSLENRIDSTLESFKDLSLTDRKLSRRTLIRWRKQWKISCEDNYGAGNVYDLKGKSKKPINYRQSKVSNLIVRFIQKNRIMYPNLGKDKLKVLTDEFCFKKGLNIVSTSTIGRIIKTLKEQKSIPIYKYSKQVYLDGRTGTIKQRIIKSKRNNKTRRKDYQPQRPGDLIQLDAVTFSLNGTKRYLICAVDLVSRYSFVCAYKTLSSNSTTDFFKRIEKVFPYQIKHVQTDNGQENHKNFQELLKQKEIVQFWNYPRSPKMNAYIERFNRTIQEEFANYNLWTLKDDIDQFNRKLKSYLNFYNHQRPHLGLKKDYGQFISPVQYMNQYHLMCHM